jgi:hypothetical protein
VKDVEEGKKVKEVKEVKEGEATRRALLRMTGYVLFDGLGCNRAAA